MASHYQEEQRKKGLNLIKDKNPVFYDGRGGAIYKKTERDFVLTDFNKNLFHPIKDDAINYFAENGISWWGGKKPTGHILSSQIACVNHLFPLRHGKDATLSLANNISNDFIDVLPIITDDFDPAYIQFEAVSYIDNLNEKTSRRGSNCTSIDALIHAVHKDGKTWLIPIEWKYTEHYGNLNKAKEGCKANPEKCKGKERQRRYTDLINGSKQLKSENHYCYYFEPFYQLMRQTLWTEQLIKNRQNERLKASDYLHVHIIPSENLDLLNKQYKCSNKDMETTWREHLQNQSKYVIISPEKFLDGINKKTYEELIKYLTIRYW